MGGLPEMVLSVAMALFPACAVGGLFEMVPGSVRPVLPSIVLGFLCGAVLTISKVRERLGGA